MKKSFFVCFLVFIVGLSVSCGTDLSRDNFISATVSSLSRTQTPTKTEDATQLPRSTSTLEGSKVGGITGVFASPTSPPPSALNYLIFNDIFRFYENGLVIGTKVGIETDTIEESWNKIRVWFNEENNDLARGTYYILDNRIWFNVSDTGHMLATNYSGGISKNKLTLNFYNERDGSYGENIEFFTLESGNP